MHHISTLKNVPTWDSAINREVCIRHSDVGYGSGEAIVDHLIDNLKAFGFEIPYVRNHLIGMAMDGQYTCLNVGDHMKEKLQKDVNLSWDPMHQIEIFFDPMSECFDTSSINNFEVGIQNTYQ